MWRGQPSMPAAAGIWQPPPTKDLLARRIRKGHPIPLIKHVKSHVIGVLAGSQIKPEHHLNERADEVAKAAAAQLEPNPMHELAGLPRFYLTGVHTGAPLNHHARHVITKRSQEGIISQWARDNRAHGQLLRGNTDAELIKAAAKYMGNTPALRKTGKLRILALTQQLPTPKIIVRRGGGELHGHTERTMTCDHHKCLEAAPQLDAVHLITGRCHERMWADARRLILEQIEKVRRDEATHKALVEGGAVDRSTGQPAKHPKGGHLPPDFPERGPRGRELNWLNPRWPPNRDEEMCATRTTGRRTSGEPWIRPRELPCPPDPSLTSGEHLTPQQAHEALNMTNPARTILGAPPTQLRSLFRVLQAKSERATRLWAQTICPALLGTLPQALTYDRKRAQPKTCPFQMRCETCQSAQSDLSDQAGAGPEHGGPSQDGERQPTLTDPSSEVATRANTTRRHRHDKRKRPAAPGGRPPRGRCKIKSHKTLPK